MHFPTYFFIAILTISYSLDSINGSIDSCHLRELEFCAATLLVFTRNTQGLQGTEAEIDLTCGYIKEAHLCAKNFTQRCLTNSQLEFVDFFEGGRSLANEFCTPGTEIREKYKKHGQCLSEARSQSKQCFKDLQKSIAEVTQTSWNLRIAMACCGYNRFRECLSVSILNRCGEEALSLSRQITHIFSSRLPEIMCQSFDAVKCEEIPPPTGTEPLGDQDNSVLSRILSSYIGN